MRTPAPEGEPPASPLTGEKAEAQKPGVSAKPRRRGKRPPHPRSHGLQRQGPPPAPRRRSVLLPGCRAATMESPELLPPRGTRHRTPFGGRGARRLCSCVGSGRPEGI